MFGGEVSLSLLESRDSRSFFVRMALSRRNGCLSYSPFCRRLGFMRSLFHVAEHSMTSKDPD